MTHVSQNLNLIDATIRSSCQKVGRDPHEVTLIAVTKNCSLDQALELKALGVKDLAENRLPQAYERLKAFRGARVHFIGHLQTNKVNKVVGNFFCIHSVDRISLIDAIEKKARQLQIKQKCFIQINVSGEDSKGGFSLDQCDEAIKYASHCEHLDILGLMTMAPFGAGEGELRKYFASLRGVKERFFLRFLSMGMSHDFEIAIEEGATHIRLGRILFE